MAIDPTTAQTVAIGAGSLQSSALGAGAWIVTASGNCWIATGANPTAQANTNGSAYVPANFPTPVTISTPNWKIAVIRDGASSGNLSIVAGGD